MALARFFDKAALAASHVLRGFDQRLFAESLSAKKIAVFFDEAAENSQEGRWTLELAVNLLARLYPKVSIVSTKNLSLEEQLANGARAINPKIDIDRTLDETSLCLVVGTTAPPVGSLSIFVGSDGWITKVSSKGPIGSANTLVPFGADAAACIGVANLFRATFRDQLEDGCFDQHWQCSLLDFDPLAQSPANPKMEAVNFGDTHLVGLGAIGNGCIQTLSRMRGLQGTIHLVDDQVIELSNLQRYALTTDTSVGHSKVDLAAESLVATGLEVLRHPRRWGVFLAGRGDWKIRRIAVAVDSAKDRQAVQAALPEWIVNAWTQVGDLGVSRHAFLGDQACLACLYLPTEPQKNEDEIVAEAIGLPNEVRLVRQLLMTNEGLDRAFIQNVADAIKIDIGELIQFVGQPLRNFYANAVCGGILLRLGATPMTQRRVEVPMAFQSALAGVFLAAELVAKGAGLKHFPPPVTTKINLLRPLGPYLSLPTTKHPSGNCICQDADYVSAFKQKYQNGDALQTGVILAGLLK
jgi:hypothetical protein